MTSVDTFTSRWLGNYANKPGVDKALFIDPATAQILKDLISTLGPMLVECFTHWVDARNQARTGLTLPQKIRLTSKVRRELGGIWNFRKMGGRQLVDSLVETAATSTDEEWEGLKAEAL